MIKIALKYHICSNSVKKKLSSNIFDYSIHYTWAFTHLTICTPIQIIFQNTDAIKKIFQQSCAGLPWFDERKWMKSHSGTCVLSCITSMKNVCGELFYGYAVRC